jgi:type IX secretion system PorP/SprF family membrane protein
MKNMKLRMLLVSLLMTGVGNAQISSRLEQYYNDVTVVNAAAMGAASSPYVSLFYNRSYAGVNGAPQNMLANVVLPSSNKKTAFGILYLKESAGFGQLHNAYVSYSYGFPLGDESKLSFGLSAGVLSQNFDVSKAVYISQTDPVVNAIMLTPSATRADFRASAWYTYKGFYAGLSGTRLTTPGFQFKYYNYAANVSLQNIATAIAGVNISVSEKSKIQPSVMFQTYNMTFARWQANVSWSYTDKFWLGFSAGDAGNLGGNAGFKPHDGVKVGYQVSIPTGANSRLLGNTHELYVGIGLNSQKKAKSSSQDNESSSDVADNEVESGPAVQSRTYKKVSVSSKEELEKEGLDLDTAGITINPLDSTAVSSGIYLVVGLHSSQLNADKQIEQIYMMGRYSWKFYDPVNKSYYVYIRMFKTRADASQWIMNNDTGLPQAWIREVK